MQTYLSEQNHPNEHYTTLHAYTYSTGIYGHMHILYTNLHQETCTNTHTRTHLHQETYSNEHTLIQEHTLKPTNILTPTHIQIRQHTFKNENAGHNRMWHPWREAQSSYFSITDDTSGLCNKVQDFTSRFFMV